MVVRFQQKIVTIDSQNNEEVVEDDREWWIFVSRRKKENSCSLDQKKSLLYQPYKREGKARLK